MTTTKAKVIAILRARGWTVTLTALGAYVLTAPGIIGG
jgi:hypothetical protein